MTYIDKIIDAFGGVRPLARAVNQSPTNISGWRKRGSMPDWQKIQVLAAAQRMGIELVLTDFLPAPFKNCPAASWIDPPVPPPAPSDASQHDDIEVDPQ